MKPIQTTKLSLLALAAAIPGVIQAAQIDVIVSQTVNNTAYGTGVNAITANTTWTKDNIYILKDKVFVTNGATLTIEAGTKIYSTLDVNNPGIADDVFGSLVITRGAKIQAEGTASEPIVFTTTDELEAETQTDIDGDGFVADIPEATTYGRWGGVIILGSAPIANYTGTTNIGEDRVEGFQPAASADLDGDTRADVIEYGGSAPADNSGVFRYVSIRHGGYIYSTTPTASEINGLTLGGVGSGTSIDHIEVYANADDGIEFFGGTVNTNHIVLAFNQDDGFDIDQGYSGTNQFWFVVQAPFATNGIDPGHDNGGEWDGVTGSINDNAANSAPVIYNATFIGSGTTALSGNDKGNNAILVDDYFKGKVYNSVFDDFKDKLIEVTSDGKGAGLEFAHNTIGRFGGGSYNGSNSSNLSFLDTAALASGLFFDASGAPVNGNSNGGTNPQYRNYSRTAVGNHLQTINPLPAATSPLLQSNGATLQAGAPVATNYRGAFGSVNWAAGWTKFDQQKFFSEKVDVIVSQTVNNTAYGTGVNAIPANTTWTKDNIYILKDKVFVTNGATLTIEAGTKIYSTLDVNNPGIADDVFGSLVITRGAKIQAEGTASEPIVFTTTDELEAETQTDIDGDGFVADIPEATTYGRWGGVIILGSAPIANYTGTTNIGEDRVEGFQPAASADLDGDTRADVIEYGGSAPADNSGVFRYVSIRHGGYIYSTTPTASEINGLTLGGVGSGTSIDHIEVYANADDGIEFFGGTVNTNHIVLAFNQDDGFDIDQGYSGTNQFWFVVQAPFATNGIDPGHDNGGEWDGVTGSINDNAANSAPVIYNATFIGSGTTALSGNDKGNNAILVDDYFKGKVYNSVFDDFKDKLIEVTSDGKGAGLEFAHNTIGRFGGGSYNGSNSSNLSFLDTAALASGLFFDASGAPVNGNSNGGTNPQYRNYSRTAVGNYLLSIDPRPATGSPLWTTNLKSGAPVATTFRGAFGSVNWAAGWTKMSFDGLLLGEPSTTPGGPTLAADTDGDGISDAVEAANTSLGFSPTVSNGSPSSVFSGLYTPASIQDLRGTGVIVQKVGNSVNLTLPVWKSNTLMNDWEPAGSLGTTINDVPADKQFYRIQVDGLE